MAQFSAMQGDIWSIGGISFVSPVNDILDKESYSLEELLQEDEILQEVKARNGRLIDFIVQESNLMKMVDYIITPPPPNAPDTRVFKLPYMSCEIFCCEIPELLHYLAEDENDRLLHKLFTILDSSEPLDNYLAGYFEKILEMFFRRLTAPVMRLLNDESTSVQLLGKFLNHIDNYSVMQVVQRLLLPHIPFTMGSTDTGPAAAAASSIEPQPSEERDFLSCGWSYLPATCHQLCQRMLQPAANPDVPAHVSDLLITVLQLSPPDALFLAHLCEPECVSALVTAAFVAGSEEVVGLTETPSPTAAISLAAISVLESLVSKLCEGMGTADANGEGANPEQLALSQAVVSSSTESLVSLLIPSLPLISSQLKGLGEQAAQHTIFIQDKRSVPRLGHRGLQLVKLLESLVRIDVPAVDAAVISSGALLACIDLMFVFEMNSLLHLAVQRIVVMIIEGGAAKLPALEYLLKESNLLPRIISVVRSLDNKDQQQQQRAHTKLRSPVTGHLIHMAQTIHAMVSPSSAGKEGEEKTESGSYSLVLPLLKETSYYQEWEPFMGDVLEKLLAIQNAPQLIEEVRGEGVTTLAQSSNFSQVMFNTDRPDNGFFDDDDDDDDDIGIAYPMGDGEGSMEADFAQFDAFSATMQLSGGGSDSGSDNDAGSFSFASFDDPNVFTSSASSSSGAAALPSTQHGVQATGEKLDDIFSSSSSSDIFSVFDFNTEAATGSSQSEDFSSQKGE